MLKVLFVVCATWLALACTGRKEVETGYLLHEDAGYTEVDSPDELFAPGTGSELKAVLALDSESLTIDRGFLRYRVLNAGKFYTVHRRPDPEFSVSAGEYRVGIQTISFDPYVTQTRIDYALPVTFYLRIGDGERVVAKLSLGDDGQVEIRANGSLVQAETVDPDQPMD